MKIDISHILQKYSRIYEVYFQKLVATKKSLDGSSFSPLKNKRPKGHLQNLNSRLNDTGRFAQNWINVKPTDTDIIIKVNSGGENGQSYSNLVIFNTITEEGRPTHITVPPKIFPSQEELDKLEVTKNFRKELEVELGEKIRIEVDRVVNKQFVFRIG